MFPLYRSLLKQFDQKPSSWWQRSSFLKLCHYFAFIFGTRYSVSIWCCCINSLSPSLSRSISNSLNLSLSKDVQDFSSSVLLKKLSIGSGLFVTALYWQLRVMGSNPVSSLSFLVHSSSYKSPQSFASSLNISLEISQFIPKQACLT